MRVRAIALGALFVAGVASGQPLGLKGFHIGDEMKACPSGAASIGLMQGAQTCAVNIESLAGQPVKRFLVSYDDGRIVNIAAAVDGGSETASALRDALAEIYGPPTSNKAHIDEYTWARPQNRGISIMGNRYNKLTMIFVVDNDANARIEKRAAKKNKGDL